jgi:multidrug efflux pump subunit AcrA (membrane-fusion protein)
MKVLKTLMVILLTGAIIAAVAGCGSKSDTASAATQEYTVKKGDISLTITAAGNLALAKTEDMAVDLFYPTGTKGTIGSVLVEEGDSVQEGQVLVTLDTDEWNDQLSNLEDNLTAAERNVTTKNTAVTDAQRQLDTLQRAVTTAENALATAQRNVQATKLAITSAELNVQSANNTLNQIAEVKKAKDAVDYAELGLKIIMMMISGDSLGGVYLSDTQIEQLSAQITQAQNYVLETQEEYENVINGTGVTTSTDVALLIAQKKYLLDQAVLALENAKAAADNDSAVTDAQLAVDEAEYKVTKQQQTLDNANLDLDDAKSGLAEAQKKLDEAKAKSPEIKAPFDGFVTKVNVAGGDEVLNGTVTVTVADPTRFEADILVSEMDIMKVGIGGNATMTLNALPGLTIPAKITYISPTATISSGVVNYNVKVELDATAVARMQAAGNRPAASTANATGQLSAALQRMVDSGRITEEQAQTFQQQGGQAGGFSPQAGITLPEGFTPPAGFTPRTGSSSAASQVPSTTTQNFQLKQGLTGTVDLIVSQQNNVLLVPNNALTRAGNQSTVQVLKADGTTEKRTVETGLSDWQNTEITGGLTDGEIIIVPKGTVTTSSSSSSSQQRPPAGGIFFGR